MARFDRKLEDEKFYQKYGDQIPQWRFRETAEEAADNHKFRNVKPEQIDNMGNRYIGQWRNGKKDGYGKMVWIWDNKNNPKERFSYEGYWSNGLEQGYGTYRSDEGWIYEGNWWQGQRCGYGTVMWPNGASYSGYWLNGLWHGKGEYRA